MVCMILVAFFLTLICVVPISLTFIKCTKELAYLRPYSLEGYMIVLISRGVLLIRCSGLVVVCDVLFAFYVCLNRN